jgi:hypothetical protein
MHLSYELGNFGNVMLSSLHIKYLSFLLQIVNTVSKAEQLKDVADKHFFWPIPVGELNFNKALDPSKDQNPGY